MRAVARADCFQRCEARFSGVRRWCAGYRKPLAEGRALELRQERDLAEDREHMKSRTARMQDGSQWRCLSEIGRDPDQRVVIKEISQLGREHKWQEALALFAGVHEPDAVTRSATIGVCAKAMRLEVAQRLFAEMPQKTVPAFNTMIALYARLRRMDDAKALFAEMQRIGLTPTIVTYGALITAFGQVNDADGAEATFKELLAQGIEPNKVIYGTLLSAHARCANTDRAFEVFQDMEKAGFDVDEGHLTNLIVACARTKQEARAREVFDSFARRGFRHDVVAYSSMILTMGGPGHLARAEALFAEMLEKGLVPNSYSYSAMMQVAIEARNPDRCAQLLADLDARRIPRTPQVTLRIRQLDDFLAKQASEQRSVAAQAGFGDGGALPEDWQTAVDPNSGRNYYWRASDPASTTTWTRPA